MDAYPDSDLGELTDSDGDGAPDALPEASNAWLMDGDGSLGVGPSPGSTEWWSAVAADRPCYFDDRYIFEPDGTFRNELDDETFVEAWQGGADSCATPVSPHDGSSSATYTFDEDAGTLTIQGRGAYIGLPKAVNGQELSSSADTPDSIVYQILESSDDYLAVTIETGAGVWWTFRLRRGQTDASYGDGMSVDAFPNDANASLDTDGDGKPDDWNPGYDGTGSSLTVDADDDNDGVPDDLDDLPKDASDSVDTDGDGVGDSTDSDDDGDNFDDQTEVNSGTNPLDRAEYPFQRRSESAWFPIRITPIAIATSLMF